MTVVGIWNEKSFGLAMHVVTPLVPVRIPSEQREKGGRTLLALVARTPVRGRASLVLRDRDSSSEAAGPGGPPYLALAQTRRAAAMPNCNAFPFTRRDRVSS